MGVVSNDYLILINNFAVTSFSFHSNSYLGNLYLIAQIIPFGMILHKPKTSVQIIKLGMDDIKYARSD